MGVKKIETGFCSEADYLKYFANDPFTKYEYINGYAYAMAGSSTAHNTIALNLAIAFRQKLALPCRPFISDIKVYVEQKNTTNNYYFPDVVVDCSEFEGYFADNPVFIAEILSKSTKTTDFIIKLADYQKIPSLQEYLIIEQDRTQVYLYRRDNDWQREEVSEGEICLKSLNLCLTLDEIYERVVF